MVAASGRFSCGVTLVTYVAGSDIPVTGVQEFGGVSVSMVKYGTLQYVFGQDAMNEVALSVSKRPRLV